MLAKIRLAILFLILIPVAFAGAGTQLRVLYPQNIGFLMDRLKMDFEKHNPAIQIKLEPLSQMKLAGSADEVLKGGDVVIISDALLLGESIKPHIAESDDFMTDEIAIVAANGAPHFDQLGERTWYFFLLKPEVRLAKPDPDSPVSLRVPLCWKLAENWVKNMLVYEDFTAKFASAQSTEISPLQQISGSKADYTFDYLTAARQSNLKFFRLMKYFNLGDPSLANTYKAAAIEAPFGSTEKKLINGEPLIYRIGVLKQSAKAEAARSFFEFLTGDDGKAILTELDLQPYSE